MSSWISGGSVKATVWRGRKRCRAFLLCSCQADASCLPVSSWISSGSVKTTVWRGLFQVVK